MDLSSFGPEWQLLAVFLLCFMGILLMRGRDRFWLPCVTIWLFLFFAWIVGAAFNRTEMNYQEAVVQQTGIPTKEGRPALPIELQQAREKGDRFGSRMLHLLGFHSFQSLFWLLIGYRKTGLPYYRKAAFTFGFAVLLYLVKLSTLLL